MSAHEDERPDGGLPEGLDDGLQALALRVEPPVPAGAAAVQDLARGRRRLRRRRVAVVTGVVATVLGVVGSVSALPGMLDAAQVEPADGPSRTAEPTPTPTRRVFTEWAVDPQRAYVDLSRDEAAVFGPTLAEWNDVLAGHVDPDRAHLRPWTRRTSNMQLGTGDRDHRQLGARYAWSEPGQTPLAMLQLEVGGSRQTLMWRCDDPYREDGTTCRDLGAPEGFRDLEEARDGDVVAVAAEREDGETVVVAFDPWFAQNSLTPLATEPPTVEQLVAAATDPRLTLAGVDLADPVGPDRRTQILTEGARIMGGDGEDGLDPTPVSGGAGALLRRPGVLAEVRWEVQPVRDEAVTLEQMCVRGTHGRCRVREEDGRQVLIAELGGIRRGFEVFHRGPTHWVRVRVEARRGGVGFLRDRALDMVVHEAWQDAG